MDELALLHEALTGPQSEPSAEVVARGRDALLRAAARDAGLTRLRRVRTARRPLLWSAVAAATAAAAMVGLAVVPGGGPSTRAPAASGSANAPGFTAGPSLDGRPVLLAAAADVVTHSAATTGAYWTTRTITLQTWTVEGGYRVTARSLLELWVSHDGSRTWIGSRTLGAAPATAADRAAWQRAGSPSSFTVPASSEAAPMRLDSTPGPLSVHQIPDGIRHSALNFGGCQFTPARALALPSDQRALSAELKTCAAVGEELPLPSGATRLHPPVWGGLVDLLTDWPVTPATQAAAYRLLAAQTNVRDLGPATDPLGRSGTQLLISDADGHNQVRFIVDPASGRVLSGSKGPADLTVASSSLGGSWTDRVQEPTISS